MHLVLEPSGPGGLLPPPQILEDTLTISESRGTDYANNITNAASGFLDLLMALGLYYLPSSRKKASPKVEWLCVYFLRLIGKISLLIYIQNKFILVAGLLNIYCLKYQVVAYYFIITLLFNQKVWCMKKSYIMIHVIKHDMDPNSNINYRRKIL